MSGRPPVGLEPFGSESGPDAPSPSGVPDAASASRPATPTASTGAATWVRADSPAIVNIAAGARSQSPRQGLRSQVVRPSRSAAPAGPTVRSRSEQSSSAPPSRQAMSSQTWAMTGGRGVVANSA